MTDILPTAEEMEQSGEYEDYSSMMTAFAKLHVQAALKSAAEKIKLKGGNISDTNCILNSYNINQIQ